MWLISGVLAVKNIASFLFLCPKMYVANLWRNLRNCLYPLAPVEINYFLKLQQLMNYYYWSHFLLCFFLKLSAFKLPRFVCLFLNTMFGARALLFNWTMSFPCQWSTLHIPHLLRSLKEFKQTLWGLGQLLLRRADIEGMLSSFKHRSPHVAKSLKRFCFQKVECNSCWLHPYC